MTVLGLAVSGVAQWQQSHGWHPWWLAVVFSSLCFFIARCFHDPGLLLELVLDAVVCVRFLHHYGFFVENKILKMISSTLLAVLLVVMTTVWAHQDSTIALVFIIFGSILLFLDTVLVYYVFTRTQ